LILLAVGAWWRRAGESPARRVIERALAPLAVGLLCAGVAALMRAAGGLEWATLGLATLALHRGASPYLIVIIAAAGFAGLRAVGLLGG
jgi:chromate transporter